MIGGVGSIVGSTTTDACFLLPMIDFSMRTNLLGVGMLSDYPLLVLQNTSFDVNLLWRRIMRVNIFESCSSI